MSCLMPMSEIVLALGMSVVAGSTVVTPGGDAQGSVEGAMQQQAASAGQSGTQAALAAAAQAIVQSSGQASSVQPVVVPVSPAVPTVPGSVVAPMPSAAASASDSALGAMVADALRRKLERQQGINQGINQGIVQSPSQVTGAAPANREQTQYAVVDRAAAPVGRGTLFTAGGEVFVEKKPQGAVVDDASFEPSQQSRFVSGALSPEHDRLDILVGTWAVKGVFDSGPGSPSETVSGTMINAWELAGRWLKQTYVGNSPSFGPITGIGYLGYDIANKRYTGSWIDTLSTGMVASFGEFDAERNTFKMGAMIETPMPDSPDGKPQPAMRFEQTQLIRILNPDEYMVTMTLTGPDGKAFQTGTLRYTRVMIKGEMGR
jgi:hypothetical protein